MSEEPLFPEGPEHSDDARLFATLCHAGGLANFVGSPIFGIGIILLIWILKKDIHPLVDEQGREALNFQFSYFIYYIVAFLLFLVLIGAFLLPLLAFAQFLFTIIAIIKVNGGERYRYPFIFRFI